MNKEGEAMKYEICQFNYGATVEPTLAMLRNLFAEPFFTFVAERNGRGEFSSAWSCSVSSEEPLPLVSVSYMKILAMTFRDGWDRGYLRGHEDAEKGL